jgi:hypothetical protein
MKNNNILFLSMLYTWDVEIAGYICDWFSSLELLEDKLTGE